MGLEQDIQIYEQHQAHHDKNAKDFAELAKSAKLQIVKRDAFLAEDKIEINQEIEGNAVPDTSNSSQ